MEQTKQKEQKPLVKRTVGQVWEQWQRKKRTMVSDSLNDTYSMFREQYIAPFADMQMAELKEEQRRNDIAGDAGAK